MELKLRCHCGQKFKFELEPINGQMPFNVQCPACGADGTEAANAMLAQLFPEPALATAGGASQPITAAAGPTPLRVNRESFAATAPPPLMCSSEPPRYIQKTVMPAPKPKLQGNILLGALGAFLGAALGVGIVFGLSFAMGFMISATVILIGLLSGAGARIMYRGSDSSLGGVAALITVLATAGTLFFFSGFFALMSVMSVMSLLISVSSAWKIGSG